MQTPQFSVAGPDSHPDRRKRGVRALERYLPCSSVTDLMNESADPRMRLNDDLRAEVDRIEGQIRMFNVIAILSVALGMVLAAGAFFWLNPEETVSEAMVASVGVASAFWALAGLFLLYVSFLGQRVDLVYNRQELRDTREQIEGQRLELARQAEQMELQGETIGRQAFEGMFFQLLRRLGDVVSTLEVSVEVRNDEAKMVPRSGTGVKAFRLLAEALSTCFAEQENGEDGTYTVLASERIASVYGTCYGLYGHYIGHYMATLRTTLQLIDQQAHSIDTSRRVYADIVSAQLSVPERTILFYHCRTGVADEALQHLVEKYSLLEPVQPDQLLQREHYDALCQS
jgi:hypothetical protein